MAAPDFAIDTPLLGRAAARPASAAAIEQEVMAFFDRYRHRLLRYALCLGISVQESEDVVQETFLSLFKHLQLGKPRDNLAGWLFRVTHNLAIRQRNAKQRERTRFEHDSQTVEHQLDGGANPEEQLAHRQRREQLLAVVQILPEKDRLCLALRAEGLRYREIGKILGISLGAVSISLARSIARIECVDAR